jgi:hypothetical protein
MKPVNTLFGLPIRNSHTARLMTSLCAILLMAGCALPGGGAGASRMPVVEREFKCFGSGMDRKTCIGDASRLCSMGFELYEKDVVGEDGETRTGLYFRCRP